MHEVVKTGCVIFTSSELSEGFLWFCRRDNGNKLHKSYLFSPLTQCLALCSMCSCGGEEGDRHQLALLLPVGGNITSPAKRYHTVWPLSPTFLGKELHFHLIGKEIKSHLKFTVQTLGTLGGVFPSYLGF